MVTTGWLSRAVLLVAVGLGAVENASLAGESGGTASVAGEAALWTTPVVLVVVGCCIVAPAGRIMGVLFVSTTDWIVPMLEAVNLCCQASTVARYAFEWL